jgi:hypothetical protein
MSFYLFLPFLLSFYIFEPRGSFKDLLAVEEARIARSVCELYNSWQGGDGWEYFLLLHSVQICYGTAVSCPMGTGGSFSGPEAPLHLWLRLPETSSCVVCNLKHKYMSRFRFPRWVIRFFLIDLILPAALWPWGRLSF